MLKQFHLFIAVIVAVIFFRPSEKLFAQETGTLRGLVADSTTSEALAYSAQL